MGLVLLKELLAIVSLSGGNGIDLGPKEKLSRT